MSAQTPPTAPQVAGALLLDASQRRKLLGYARSRFGIAAEDAEDLLQDTLLELLRQRAHVRSPEGYVFTLFRLSCARYVEAARAREEVFAPETEPGTSAEPSGPETISGQVALRQALVGISSVCRRILSAFYIEGRSLRETADSLAVAESGVTKTINRCLRRLRACLN